MEYVQEDLRLVQVLKFVINEGKKPDCIFYLSIAEKGGENTKFGIILMDKFLCVNYEVNNYVRKIV